MRIGFHIGPLSFSESTRRRKMSKAEEQALRKLLKFIILSPYYLIRAFVRLLTLKQRKLREELKTPQISLLHDVNDDRPKPPIKVNRLSKNEYEQKWSEWRYSQDALHMMTKSLKMALPLLNQSERIYPNSQFIKYAQAIALFYTGHRAESYDSLVHLPEKTALLQIMVDGALSAKKYDQCINLIFKLPQRVQKESKMIFKHAICLIGLKKWNAALEVLTEFNYRKSENKGHNSSMWHYLRGQCYEGLEKIGSSVREYEKTLAYPLDGIDIQAEIRRIKTLESHA